MLAAVYYNNRDIRVQEMPKLENGLDEILLKVMASGICGSDVLEWYRVPSAPRVLGHEATGIVEAVGEKVKNYRIGDRVFVSHHVPCNRCRYCLRGHHTACETLHTTNYIPGGFSQYIRVPRINVEQGTYRIPSNVSFEEGTFIEPLGCVVRGQRLADTANEGNTVLVIGCGISGILHLQLARMRGIKNLVASDINPWRLEQAEKFGADHMVDSKENLPQKLKDVNEGRLADQVIVCTGATQAVLTALECVDRGGTILFFAVPDPTVKVPIPITEFWRNEITIKTSYGAAPRDLEESLQILSERKINVRNMITHRLSLVEIAKGFRLMTEADKSLKIIIEPNKNYE